MNYHTIKGFISKYLSDVTKIFLFQIIVIIPLLSWQHNLDTTLYVRFLALNIFILLALVTYLLINKKNKLWNYNNWFIVFFVYVVISSINLILSTNTSDAIFQFSNITSFFALVFLLYNFLKNDKIYLNIINVLFILITDIVIIKLIIELYRTITDAGINHQTLYKINAGFSHKNILSEILIMLLPYSLYSITNERKKIKLIGIINSVLLIFFITILLTRAVWIAFFVGCILIFFVFLLTSHKFFTAIKVFKITSIIIISIVLILGSSLIIYSKQDSFETIKKSFRKIVVLYDSSQHRFELWNRTLEIFYSNPLFGTGLSTWKIEVLKFGNRNLASEDNITFYQRPHNDYLWILSEQGIIGFIFYFLSLLLILKYLFKNIRKSKNLNEYLFWLLILFSLICYMTFSFFAFPKERVEHQIIIAVIFSLTLANVENTLIFKNKILNMIFSISFIILIILNIFIGYQRVKSDFFLKKAFVERFKQNWNSEIKFLNKSDSYFYKIDPFSTPLAWYKGEALFNLGKTEIAFKEFKTAYKINPNHIHVLNNLATCYQIKGESNYAIPLYKKAITLSPTFNDAILNLTAVYFNQNQIDSAITIIKTYKGLSTDEKYRNYLITILKTKIINYKNICDDKLIISVLENILLNNDWVINIFDKSKEKNINFESQLLTDVIYTLENIERKITYKQKEHYLKKFKL